MNYAYGNALSLSNSGDQIDVVWAGEVVDSFVYEPEGFVIESGISLQLGSESLSATANDSSESWCSSLAATGETSTPGAPNGSCAVLVGTCGDGETQPWESCDDGNDLDGDGCETTCTDTPLECGNGLVQEGEECDDGNEIDGDGCETDCTFTPPECGNGVPEGTEACDDGNEVDGDGCETDCTLTIVLPGQILISEFMANPSGVADSQGEWLELWNGASISVNLEGWTLRDLGSNEHVIDEPLIVEPGGLILLSNGTAEASEVPTQYVYSGFTLGNSSDEIFLERPDGAVIDSLSYPNDSFAIQAGESVSREPSTLVVSADPVEPAWCAGKIAYGTNGNLGSPGK